MLQVLTLPYRYDNYAYILIDTQNKVAAVIDPFCYQEIYALANQHDVRIQMILTTHGHFDHHDGNAPLQALIREQEQRDIPVYGNDKDQVQAMTHSLRNDDTVQLGELTIRAIETPCHTRGSLFFLCQDALFTGDTLPVAGVGRFFMGTPQDMHDALFKVLATLPDHTKIYPGHEYAVRNLSFATLLEPDNLAVREKLLWALQQQQAKQPAVPSTVGNEKRTNPFLRLHESAIQKVVGCEEEVEVLGKLRELKTTVAVGRYD